MKRKKRNNGYGMFEHNRFNRVSYKNKPWFKRKDNVFDAPVRLKRNDMFLTIRWKTQLREHHNDNSYYDFPDRYKGRRYIYIHGSGILELRTDTYVKKFDDPILGWANTNGK